VIAVERFIAPSSMREEWLAARALGVTATQVAKASTPAGMTEVLAQLDNPQPIIPNAVMEWGIEREPHIALHLKQEFGLMPNEWLICAEGVSNEWMMATPDGLSLDHSEIAEIKTTGKPFASIPMNYRRQIQWQLHCTGATRCLFAWELRLEGPEGFAPGLEIHTEWVNRDEKMIAALIETAQQVQMHGVLQQQYIDQREEEIKWQTSI
jgi:hypothetical protein